MHGPGDFGKHGCGVVYVEVSVLFSGKKLTATGSPDLEGEKKNEKKKIAFCSEILDETPPVWIYF